MAHEHDSFFKVYRSLLGSGLWLQEPFTKGQAWVDLIGMANYADLKKYSGDDVTVYKRGQVVTSVVSLATRWQWSRHKVSDFLESLQADEMVSQKRTSFGTVVTIENYAFYQSIGQFSGHQKDSERTAKGHQKDSGGTQNKKGKNIKNIKKGEREGLRPYGPDGRLSLTADEYSSFLGLYPDDAARFIDELDEYKGASGKEYKNDFDALKRWARNDKKFKSGGGGSKYKTGLEKVKEEIENGTFTF